MRWIFQFYFKVLDHFQAVCMLPDLHRNPADLPSHPSRTSFTSPQPFRQEGKESCISKPEGTPQKSCQKEFKPSPDRLKPSQKGTFSTHSLSHKSCLLSSIRNTASWG